MLSRLSTSATLRWLAAVVGVAVAYFACAQLGRWLSFGGIDTGPVWFPAGLGLAALLLFGRRLWPGVFIGAFSANVALFATQRVADAPTVGFVAACIAVGNTAEALAGVFVIRRWIGNWSPFGRTIRAFKFVAIAPVVGLLGSLVGVVSLLVTKLPVASGVEQLWLSWWLGNTTGVLLLTPALYALKHPGEDAQSYRSTTGDNAREQNGRSLSSSSDERPLPRPKPKVPWFLLAVTSALVAALVIAAHIGSAAAAPLGFALLVPLLWAAFRTSLRLTTALMLLVATAAFGAYTHLSASFSPTVARDTMLLLQVFVGIAALAVLSLAAARTERQRAIADLRLNKAIVAGTNCAVAIADRTDNLIYVNDALVRLWGFENAAQLRGAPLASLWQDAAVLAAFRAVRGRRTRVLEGRAQRSDGTTFQVQIAVTALVDRRRQQRYLLGSFIDLSAAREAEGELQTYRDHVEKLVAARTRELEQQIAQHKLVEITLRESEKRLQETQELAHLGTWEYFVEAGQMTWSAEMFAILEQPPHEETIDLAQYFALVHADDLPC